jgi:hypothetical protein
MVTYCCSRVVDIPALHSELELHGCPQFLQTNAGIFPKGHYHFIHITFVPTERSPENFPQIVKPLRRKGQSSRQHTELKMEWHVYIIHRANVNFSQRGILAYQQEHFQCVVRSGRVSFVNYWAMGLLIQLAARLGRTSGGLFRLGGLTPCGIV